jgi:hypothetical protein
MEAMGAGFPGEQGAVHPTLALHDWIHVIINVHPSPLGEIGVAAYIAAASQTQGALIAFLGTISMFEASLLKHHLDLCPEDGSAGQVLWSGALSSSAAVELAAEAIHAGRACPVDPVNDVDYFGLSEQSLKQIRQRWGLPEEGLLLAKGHELAM